PPVGGLRARVDPHGLDIAELVYAVCVELAAVPRLLHAAERQLRIRGRHAVHEHRPRFDISDEPLLLCGITRPHVGPEPEDRRVRALDRLVQVGAADYVDEWTETFILEH